MMKNRITKKEKTKATTEASDLGFLFYSFSSSFSYILNNIPTMIKAFRRLTLQLHFWQGFWAYLHPDPLPHLCNKRKAAEEL